MEKVLAVVVVWSGAGEFAAVVDGVAAGGSLSLFAEAVGALGELGAGAVAAEEAAAMRAHLEARAADIVGALLAHLGDPAVAAVSSSEGPVVEAFARAPTGALAGAALD